MNNLIPKQTSLWTTKNGQKIRICDMTDSHLVNSINYLDRYVAHVEKETFRSIHRFMGLNSGEIAEWMLENELMALEEEGLDPEDITPLYEKLCLERERRGL
jgi:hypothetical protein